MIFWLFVALFSYFLFSITALIDKYFLLKPIPNPKTYSFYIGILGFFSLFFFPFLKINPSLFLMIFLAFLSGIFRILGIYFYSFSLFKFEASRVVPAIGGILPIFTFLLTTPFSSFSKKEEFALLFLVLGTILITASRKKFITFESFSLALISAFFFGLSFYFLKISFSKLNFFSALAFLLFGSAISSFFFLFFKEVKEDVFKKKKMNRKTAPLFLTNQAFGGLATLAQNYAIFLAPLKALSLVNALEGIKYFFLFIFSVIASLKFPQILKEEITKLALFQKLIAIFFIFLGILFLFL